MSVLSETHGVFAKFISGKIIDSLIVGVLTFIIMNIAGIPYTILISVLIGVTNIIPFFGQYIGIIPSAVLVFIASPSKGVLFLILIIILMQFDGNVLGPKILGDSIGLKSFWILFSILFFGSLFGVLGMICAVPVFAVIYRMVKRFCAGRLAKSSCRRRQNVTARHGMMPGSRGTKIRKDEGYEKGQPFVMYRDSSLYDVWMWYSANRRRV